MVDRYRQDRRLVRALFRPRCRDVAALARRIRADRREHSCAGGTRAAAAARASARTALAHARRPAPARGERAFPAGIRRAGIRASRHQGRPPFLQRAARGRSAAARLRSSHRGAACVSCQGADVARRLGSARPRARSSRARERRRDPADDRAQTHSGRRRPRRRHRNRRGRDDAREVSGRILAQSASDLSRSTR